MEQNLLLKQCTDLAESLKYEKNIKIASYIGRPDRPDKIVVTVEVKDNHYHDSPFYPPFHHSPRLVKVCEEQGSDLNTALTNLKARLINSVKYKIEASLRETSELVKVLATIGVEPDVKE